MADIRAAIFARGSAFAGLTAVIGTTPTRLYPVEAQQKTTMPYATFQVISPVRQHEMAADSLGLPRVQFDCWGSTRAEAMTVRDQILAAFDRWPAGTYGGVVLDSSVCVNDGMDVERDDVSAIPRVTLEFQMSHRLT